MPRRKRNYLPGFPYHLVQRGNNRQPCFREHTDFDNYLNLWREKSRWYGVQVHAYCLMTNHIHFIVSSAETDAISNTMKVVGSRYAFHFNKRHGRSGTLWEGRHHSSLIDSERYLLTCLRYVELNPVRARMVASPDAYEWSSYALNTAPRRATHGSLPIQSTWP
jgi:putative transposase